jgi:DNA-binding transcriptional MerR regulator
MQPDPPRFSLAELVEASGVPERTVRSFITEGLVPPALGRGKARYYTSDHLERIELVAQLRADRLSFHEIRQRLAPPVEPRSNLDAEPWRRVVLHPDLELHIRDGAPDSIDALARELTAVARRWFGDE